MRARPTDRRIAWTRTGTAQPVSLLSRCSMSLLTLDRLALAAPDGRILFSNLTLALGHERVALVGRNGAGKSTLLRAIRGDLPPAAGSIALGGSIGALRQASGTEQ